MASEPSLFSRQDAALAIGVSLSTLRRMERRGVISPAKPIGLQGKKRYYDRQIFWSEVKAHRELPGGQGSDILR